MIQYQLQCIFWFWFRNYSQRPNLIGLPCNTTNLMLLMIPETTSFYIIIAQQIESNLLFQNGIHQRPSHVTSNTL